MKRHPAKPRSRSSSTSQLPEAVATTTGIVCELPTLEDRNSSSNSKPFILGIFRSVSNKLYSFRRTISISSPVSVQVSQCIPSCAYISFSIRSSTSSLSMAATLRFLSFWWIQVCISFFGTSSAFCMGIFTMKRLPFPLSLSSRIVPCSIVTILCTMASPSPKPSFAAAFERRSNAPNTRCCSSSVMPVPVSSTISISTPSV